MDPQLAIIELSDILKGKRKCDIGHKYPKVFLCKSLAATKLNKKAT